MSEPLRLVGLSADEIYLQMQRRYPGIEKALNLAGGVAVGSEKKRIARYQATCLYGLCKAYDRHGANLLEIGTYYGYTAAVMAQAAPKARITTLNPTVWEHAQAKESLARFTNIHTRCTASWDYLDEYEGPELDMIFVDGDHKEVRCDLPWFNWLMVGGLILYHDYTPNGAPRACPPVYRALKKFSEEIGREADVQVIDDLNTGMIGWIRQPGDKRYGVCDGH